MFWAAYECICAFALTSNVLQANYNCNARFFCSLIFTFGQNIQHYNNSKNVIWCALIVRTSENSLNSVAHGTHTKTKSDFIAFSQLFTNHGMFQHCFSVYLISCFQFTCFRYSSFRIRHLTWFNDEPLAGILQLLLWLL